MKSKNLFNKLFFKKQLEEEEAKYKKFKRLLGFCNEIQEQLSEVKSLGDVLETHKYMWEKGLRNENISPCDYGMFRTENISKMTLDEVYLGDIFGLHTKNGSYWESCKNEDYGPNGYSLPRDTKLYNIVLKQYRNHLRSNLDAMRTQASKYVREYELINRPLNPKEILCSE